MADFAIRRFEFASVSGAQQVIYSGEALRGVADDDARWNIWHYKYDLNGQLASIEELHGAWTERASLAWTT